MDENRKIQECMLNIDMTCRSMYSSYQDIKKFKLPLSSVIYGDMLRYSYIQLCIILDEFAILNGLAKDNLFLRDTLYIISPALKAINKFNGIRKARNLMLAHYNRDKKRNFHPWWTALRNLKLPRTQKEINLIYKWLLLINTVILTRHHDTIMAINKEIKPKVGEYFKWAEQQEKQAVGQPTPFDHTYDEVGSRLEEKGVKQIIVDPELKEVFEYFNKNVANKI